MTHYSTPSTAGLAKVGSLFNRRAALPLVRRTEFLVDMSGHLALVLPCLPGLGRGQLLHLRHCLLMPPAQSLPGHGDEGDPLPPTGLTSLVHLPGESSLQGSSSRGGCLPDQPSLEGVDVSLPPVQCGMRTSPGLAWVSGSRDLSSLVAPRQAVWVTM